MVAPSGIPSASLRLEDPLSRYRREGDTVFVDLHLRSTRQLFDARDPSPFRERDLDDDAVEYMVVSTEEIPPRTRLVFTLTFSEEPMPRQLDAASIEQAIRMHFSYEIGRSRRQLRSLFRLAQIGALVALVLLGVCLTLARALQGAGNGAMVGVLREGLSILGWVALWRPLETVLYDWWPHAARMRTLRRVASAEIEVHFGAP